MRGRGQGAVRRDEAPGSLITRWEEARGGGAGAKPSTVRPGRTPGATALTQLLFHSGDASLPASQASPAFSDKRKHHVHLSRTPQGPGPRTPEAPPLTSAGEGAGRGCRPCKVTRIGLLLPALQMRERPALQGKGLRTPSGKEIPTETRTQSTPTPPFPLFAETMVFLRKAPGLRETHDGMKCHPV